MYISKFSDFYVISPHIFKADYVTLYEIVLHLFIGSISNFVASKKLPSQRETTAIAQII